MVSSITTKIDAKYFLYLFKHKHLAPRTISKSVLLIYKNSSDIYLKFIFYVFFQDVCREMQPPVELLHTTESSKLIKCIQDRLFDDIHTLKHDTAGLMGLIRKQEIVKETAKDPVKVCVGFKEVSPRLALSSMRFLLVVEKNIPDVFYSDIEYFNFIRKRIDYSDRLKILNETNSVSPILLHILLSIEERDIPDKHLGIFYFLMASEKTQFEGMKLLESKRVGHTVLGNLVLYSNNKVVNRFYEKFLWFYPEIKYSSWKHPKRILFFENPLSVSLDSKTLKIYIPAVVDFIKQNKPELRNSPIDVLIKVIYIERLLSRETTKKEYALIHSFILDSSQIIPVLLRRKFNTAHISRMVKYIPSMFIGFDLSLKMFIKTNDSFYLSMLRNLVRKYPTWENVKKVVDHLTYFPSSFCMEFKDLIGGLSDRSLPA
ncbi:hypothetical protein NGRA_2081 [Nosema granulosis]|uniref:Uncharacterized protein n=1 Tax=Nosema granulosis TaxID=83296 RepID=A0A9P6KYJ4_9MICR|nr:hypothetical protein NGRA_2081 [Nosema granulosis]